VIAGAGPAGLAVAQRVSAAGYRVCIIDPDPLAAWPNNYGVWVDEFQVHKSSLVMKCSQGWPASTSSLPGWQESLREDS
jgi:pyruvate/2-oxoglutarate dehydrogenase complex dihydrolipoamide dehydrogenase (E3) component